MDLQIRENVEAINSELANALSFEDKFSKFTALGDVANLTASNQVIPEGLKLRILNRISGEQQQIAYCDFYSYSVEQESVDDDLRHDDMQNPIIVKK